ncbi:MAG: hypothetical protein L0H36_01540 [bacterium]|nr:hypothetical protein [bacterium]MDN5835300.1 hypothetical protein [bacterium]
MITESMETTTIYSNSGSRVKHQTGIGGSAADLPHLISSGNAFDNIVTDVHSSDTKPSYQRVPSELPIFVSVYSASWAGGYSVEITPSRENLRLINSLSIDGFRKFVHDVDQMMRRNFPDTILAFSDREYTRE